jgi:hypothetical protein
MVLCQAKPDGMRATLAVVALISASWSDKTDIKNQRRYLPVVGTMHTDAVKSNAII